MKDDEEGEEDFEWEEWNPSRISFVHHMIAGSAAGLAEHVSVFPIDTLKTHIQCERCGSMSPIQTWNCATRIVGREGIFRLWRGVSATFAGCLPGAYVTVLSTIKHITWITNDVTRLAVKTEIIFIYHVHSSRSIF